jgi:hypothetical protein
MILDRRLRVFIFLALILPLVRPSPLAGQTAVAPGRIGTIDESSRVVLRGNRHPLAIPANDRGEADPGLPMQRMLLVLKRDPDAQSALNTLLSQQQDPSSPNFHAWLTPAQFGARFGPATSDLQKVSAWLQSHGFLVSRMAQSGMVVEFGGTAGQVKQAFHTPIHSYFANGKTHFANALDPQIPAALAPVVAGIGTLHNFEKRPALMVLGTASRIGTSSLWQPNFTFNGAAGPAHYLAPGDFAKIYNTAGLYSGGFDGTGQSIAIVARTNINLSDVQIFRIAFGLPPNDPHIILDGPDPGNLFGGEETEADLDVEWSGAIAPKATINLVVSASTNSTDGVDLSAEYIVDNNLSPVLSASFMECEASLGQAENTFFNDLWEQAAAQGITVVVSSGDNGAAGCDDPASGQPATQGPAVNGLASTPFNIAVGGTQFDENGAASTYWSPTNGPDQSSVLGYIPEVVWNESCSDVNQCGSVSLFASSGGPSSLYSKPPWQSGPGVPNDASRDLPDVSLAAAGGHDGYLLCQDGICLTDGAGQLINAEVVGGTSAAAPSFAAIMALVVQKTNSRQGQANFVIYPLAAGQNAAACNSTGGPGSPQSQCIFNDITQGNNSVPGQTGATAAPGYDFATGWGSINAANLAANWTSMMFRSSTTSLQISPTSIMHGQPVTASVSVAPASGTGTPTGEVALLPGTGAALNLGPLANGSASSPTVTLPGGSYSVTAAYSGDGTFSGSSSNAVAVTVSPEASTTAFSVIGGTQSGNPPTVATTYSAPLEFQAAVVGASGQGNATGMVTFSDMFNGNSSTLTAVPLNIRGVALVSSTPLAIGTHAISASYAGDASFQPSSAGSITVTVAKGPTQTFLFVPTGALPGGSVTLQAFVIPQNGSVDPTGTVQFFSGNTALGNPVPLKNLLASFATNQLSNGSNSISAAYSGDSNFLGSTSPAATVFLGNPDFQIAANPGSLTVSTSSPASSKLFLSPGPGLGFTGILSLACSGLPASVACSFAPSSVVMNGFSDMTDTVTFSKTSTAAVAHVASLRWTRALAGMSLVSVLLLVWPRKTRYARRAGLLLLLGCLAVSNGCGGGSSTTTTTSPPPVMTTYVVTVTASGGLGTSAASHSVTLALTVQ